MGGNFDRKETLNHHGLLKLYYKLKKVIYRAENIDSLLNDVCNVIASHVIYHSAWIILLEDEKITKIYKSYNIADIEPDDLCIPCYIRTKEKGDFVVLHGENSLCEQCKFKDSTHDVVFSVPLKFKGVFYGNIFVQVAKEYANDEGHHFQFSQLAEDVSYSLYNIILEQRIESEKKGLALSQNRMKALLSASPNAVIISDLNMNITFVSEKFRDIFNISSNVDAKEFLSRGKAKYIFPKEEYIRLKSNFNSLINQQLDYSSNIYHPLIGFNKDLTIKLDSTAIVDDHGKVNGVISIIEDYSYIEKSAKERAFSERKFLTIFEEAPVGISILDSKGNFLDANGMYCKMIGYSKKEIIGKHFINFIPDNQKEEFDNYFEELLNKKSLQSEFQMLRKDSSTIIVRNNGRAIVDDDKIATIVIHSRDLTEKLLAQKRINTLSKIVDQSPAVISMTDIDGNIDYVNKRFEEVTGYTADEVIGKNPRILKASDVDVSFYAKMWNRIKKGEQWTGRFKNMKKNGEIYYEYAKISPYIENNEIIGYVKFGEDITNLVEFEKKLEESNNRYQKIFNLVQMPIIIHRDGVIIDANNAAVDFSKANSKNEVVGKEILKFIHPDSLYDVISRIQEMTKNRKPATGKEEKFYNILGEVRYVNVVSSVFNYEGEDSFMVAFFDVTESKNWLKKLSESESKFRSLFDINPSAISISRVSDGKYIEVNERFYSLTGYNEEDIIGKSFMELEIFNDINEQERFLNLLEEKGSLQNEEFKFRRSDGSTITAITSSRNIFLNGEELIVISVNDISDRKKMEQELVRAKLNAEENDKLKSAFLANMSHEIRNPMNAIIGFSDLLKDEGLTQEEQNDYINIIQSKGDELMLIINDIIDISKIESGLLEIECNDVNVQKFLYNLEKQFSTLVQSKSNGNVKFEVNIKGTEGLYVWADPHRLNQVFQNLIGNAIKFTYKGKISIDIKENDDDVIFRVTDTGIGIPKDKFELIFDRFLQVDHKKDELVGGTGLGLSITKSLVELMNGSVSVKSTVGEGSTFYIKINKSKSKMAFSQIDLTTLGFDNIDISDKEIAIVDFDKASLVYISTIIKKTKASSYVFSDLDEFINWFPSKDKLNIVIIDTEFISIESMHCFSDLKNMFPDCKIIGMSANIVQNKNLNDIKIKLDDFISKPFTKSDLFESFRKILKLK